MFQKLSLPSWEPLKELLECAEYYAVIISPEQEINTRVWLEISSSNDLIIIQNQYKVPWTYVDAPFNISYCMDNTPTINIEIIESILRITLVTKDHDKAETVYKLLGETKSKMVFAGDHHTYIPHPLELQKLNNILAKYKT